MWRSLNKCLDKQCMDTKISRGLTGPVKARPDPPNRDFSIPVRGLHEKACACILIIATQKTCAFNVTSSPCRSNKLLLLSCLRVHSIIGKGPCVSCVPQDQETVFSWTHLPRWCRRWRNDCFSALPEPSASRRSFAVSLRLQLQHNNKLAQWFEFAPTATYLAENCKALPWLWLKIGAQ